MPATENGVYRPNCTLLPDEIIDQWMAKLSGAEFKCLMYITRRTFGFRRNSDAIAVSQLCSGIVRQNGSRLDHGTGLSNSAVLDAIAKLERLGLIQAEKTRTDGGRQGATIYSLVIRQSELSAPQKVHPGVQSELSAPQKVHRQHTEELNTKLQGGDSPGKTKTQRVQLADQGDFDYFFDTQLRDRGLQRQPISKKQRDTLRKQESEAADLEQYRLALCARLDRHIETRSETRNTMGKDLFGIGDEVERKPRTEKGAAVAQRRKLSEMSMDREVLRQWRQEMEAKKSSKP